MLNIHVIKKEMLQAAIWDGGKTYEYFIYPPSSTYVQRDFLFRISSATIEKVPSHFTRFENYHRFLVMIDNSLELVRNGKKERYKKHEIFTFNSNDEIVSSSLGNDFNLMVSNEKLQTKVEILKGNLKTSHQFIFCFALTNMIFYMDNEVTSLNKGDLILIQNLQRNLTNIKTTEKCILGFIAEK